MTSAFTAVVSITRPNDTSSYSANDVIGAATGATAAVGLVPIGATQSAGEVMFTSVAFEIDRNAVISGETSYRLYLYSATPPSALGDNAAWDLPAGDRATFLGYIDLGTPVDLGSTLYVETLQVNKQLTIPGNANGVVFAYLVTIGAYTPQAQTVHKVTLHGLAL